MTRAKVKWHEDQGTFREHNLSGREGSKGQQIWGVPVGPDHRGHFSAEYPGWCRARDFKLVNEQAELGWMGWVSKTERGTLKPF